MSLFSTTFEDIKLEEIVSDGQYNLRITSTQMKTAQSGREYLLVVFQNEDVENASPIYHNINGILPQDDDNLRQIFSRMAKQFFDSFGQDYKEPDITGLVGESCVALVTQETGNDGVVRNKIKKFL